MTEPATLESRIAQAGQAVTARLEPDIPLIEAALGGDQEALAEIKRKVDANSMPPCSYGVGDEVRALAVSLAADVPGDQHPCGRTRGANYDAGRRRQRSGELGRG